MARRRNKAQTADPAAPGPILPSVSGHPRARASVRRVKGIAGLAGLLLCGLLALRAGLPPFDVAVRALVGGIVCYFVAWMGAVIVWRQLIAAEIALHGEKRKAAAEQRQAAARQAEGSGPDGPRRPEAAA